MSSRKFQIKYLQSYETFFWLHRFVLLHSQSYHHLHPKSWINSQRWFAKFIITIQLLGPLSTVSRKWLSVTLIPFISFFSYIHYSYLILFRCIFHLHNISSVFLFLHVFVCLPSISFVFSPALSRKCLTTCVSRSFRRSSHLPLIIISMVAFLSFAIFTAGSPEHFFITSIGTRITDQVFVGNDNKFEIIKFVVHLRNVGHQFFSCTDVHQLRPAWTWE